MNLQIMDLIRELKNSRAKYLAKEDDLAVESIDSLLKKREINGQWRPEEVAFARKLVEKTIGMK